MFLGKKKTKPSAQNDSDTMSTLLAEIKLLYNMDSAELIQLRPFVCHEEFSKGQVLFNEGDPSSAVYFIAKGKIDVFKSKLEGTRSALATIPAGRCIGEMSLIDRFTRSASAVAAETTTAITLSTKEFERMCEEHPKLANKLLIEVAKLMSLNLRKTSASLIDAQEEK